MGQMGDVSSTFEPGTSAQCAEAAVLRERESLLVGRSGPIRSGTPEPSVASRFNIVRPISGMQQSVGGSPDIA